MTDTPQPHAAGETEVASDPIMDAATAFKVSLGQSEERPRDEHGRFTSSAPQEAAEEDEIEAEDAGQPESEAENHDDTQEAEEAADEAQPNPDLPSSWAADKAELWEGLDPDAQAYIRQRDGEIQSAANAKFMESANARKAAEAARAEANARIENAIIALDAAISRLEPQWPSETMLDVNSSDYDPDTYHLQDKRAQREQAEIAHLISQRQQLVAQGKADAAKAVAERDAAINEVCVPALIEAYPEIKDQTKSQAFFNQLAEWGVEAGIPADMFQNLPNAAEWHILADARSWREHKKALAKVKQEPRPEPRKAQPAVRPGVTTPKSTVAAANRQKAFDKLARTGSLEDGAAIWKQFLK